MVSKNPWMSDTLQREDSVLVSSRPPEAEREHSRRSRSKCREAGSAQKGGSPESKPPPPIQGQNLAEKLHQGA